MAGKRRDFTEVLLEIHRKWFTSLDLERVLPEIVSVTQRLLKADEASLLLVDSNGKELVEHAILSRTRPSHERYRIRIRAEGITGWVAAHGKSLAVPDVRKDSRYVHTSERIRAEAAAPVVAGDRLLGVLNVESRRVHHFKAAEVRLLELHDRERRRGRQLLILHHLARVAGGAIPPVAFLQRVVDAIRREFSCHYTAVFLGDYRRGELELLAQACESTLEVRPGATLSFGNGLIGTAFKIGETINAGDVANEPLYIAKVPRVRSEICVPIRVGDHCLGILDAQSTQVDGFTPGDVIFLETTARSVAPTLLTLMEERVKA